MLAERSCADRQETRALWRKGPKLKPRVEVGSHGGKALRNANWCCMERRSCSCRGWWRAEPSSTWHLGQSVFMLTGTTNSRHGVCGICKACRTPQAIPEEPLVGLGLPGAQSGKFSQVGRLDSRPSVSLPVSRAWNLLAQPPARPTLACAPSQPGFP